MPPAAAFPSAHRAPFSLTIEGIPAEALSVQRWRIEAQMDAPYCASVVIQIPKAYLPLFHWRAPRKVVGLRACFELQSVATSFEPFHGRIAATRLGHDALAPDGERANSFEGDVVACTLELRPRLWWASLTKTSRTFQNQTVEDVVRKVLENPFALKAPDIDFRVSAPLTRRETRMQYEESDLAFVNRLLEREGLAYFFEQTDDREVMVVTDSPSGYSRPAQWSGVRFVRDAGLNPPRDTAAALLSAVGTPIGSGWNQVITHFEVAFQTVTTDFSIDDYNYRTASIGLNAEREGTATPLGHEQIYGSHARTPEEAQRDVRQLAERRTQHARRARAESTLTALSPGQSIGIVESPELMLGRWLVLGVKAWGDRESPYKNHFTAQPEAIPYRPEWDTPRPEMAGVTHMRLDTTDTGNPYARLDEQGRYLAWHYFEHGSGQEGMGSAPIRLARDSAGTEYGQHFPVHAGVEALAGYVHGDPDRPVLLGVMHDSNNPNPVTSLNASRHVVRTWANNKLRMEDKSGAEHVKLSTEYGLSQLNLGHLVNQEGLERGQGFELRTEHEGALRAEMGWLFTTAGTNVRGDPTGEGHQLNIEPIQEQIRAARPWADHRSTAATQVGLEAASSLKAADDFEKNLPGIKTPMQAHYSSAGMVYSARKNVILGAEQSQGFYAVGPINLVSNLPFGLTAKKGLRLHAESGGIRQVVSDGDYTVHVQKGDWTLLAEGGIQFESLNGVFRVQTRGGEFFWEMNQGKVNVRVSTLKINAGEKIDFTGGPVTGRAGTDAGARAGLDYFGKMEVKDKGFDDKFIVKGRNDQPMANVDYVMRNTLTGQVAQGRTDATGRITKIVEGAPEDMSVELKRTERS